MEEREETPVAARQAGGSAGEASDRVDSTVYEVGDLLSADLDRLASLLPAETRVHLKNARTEAALALYHLWKGIESVRTAGRAPKVRRHIDIE